MQNVQLINLGLKDYKETWEYQESIFQKTIDIKIDNRRNQAGQRRPGPGPGKTSPPPGEKPGRGKLHPD